MIKIKKYGWKPSLPDQRDRKFGMKFMMMATPLPPSVDLSGGMPAVYNQGSLGSCTANAGAGLGEFLMKKLNKKDVYTPSRLAIYYWTRIREGTVNEDSGASLRNTMMVLSGIGCPHESLWPYKISRFRVKPTKPVITDANKHKVGEYVRLNNTNLNELKQCLAMGFPFMFGFAVYDSFESATVAKTGIMPMPKPSESLRGGHAVLCLGYSDEEQMFTVRNSWGSNWGKSGNFKMPYAYMTNGELSQDFWSCHTIN
jgi:C1A family cysteine protease